jgi:hypothetical protein
MFADGIHIVFIFVAPAALTHDGVALRDIWLLRLRALLARADGDSAAYADFRDRYRDLARTLGFEGHIEGCPKELRYFIYLDEASLIWR